MKPAARSLALLGSLLLPLWGCELFEGILSEEFQIPVDLETPEMDLNVTEQVDAVESGLCSDADSFNCAVVQALDYSDDEEVSDPPQLPEQFPVEIEVVNPETGVEETVNVEDWAAEVGLSSDFDLKQAVPMDVTSLLGVDSPDAVQSVAVTDLVLNWKENTFTFETVPMELYVSDEYIEDITDPDGLLAEGRVTRVGTIPAQEPGVAGESPIEFVDGGNEVFNDALRGLRFTLLVAMPEGAEMGLSEGAEPGTRVKPTGDARVTVKATLEYTVSASDIASQIDEAGE